MIRLARFVPVLVLVFLAAAARAGATPSLPPSLPSGLVSLGAARVVSVVDGDTVVLDDGRQVRLVGTQAPKLPLGRKNFTAWPLGEDSKAALDRLVRGQAVTLHGGGATMDRHGRVLAHLVRGDGLWIQGAMIAAGMARVYSFPDNRAAVTEMLALETAARQARRGIWAHDYYAVRTPDSVAGHVGGYELVEGRVMSVATVKARTYLNFGADYKRDFTIVLNAAARRALAKRSIKPPQFEDSTIRVRGWVSWENGPMIAVTHPEQIEVLVASEAMKKAALKPERKTAQKNHEGTRHDR